MDRIFSSNLLCLIPTYTKTIGDSTKIYTENASPFTINKSLSTVLKLIYNYYSIDIKSLHNICSNYIINQNLIPIPFDENNIFIPFKARIPKYKNDSAFGYFNLNYFSKYKLNENINIIFKDKQSVECISKETSFKKHLHNGYIIKSSYKKRCMNMSSSSSYVNTFKDLSVIIDKLSSIENLLTSLK